MSSRRRTVYFVCGLADTAGVGATMYMVMFTGLGSSVAYMAGNPDAGAHLLRAAALLVLLAFVMSGVVALGQRRDAAIRRCEDYRPSRDRSR